MTKAELVNQVAISTGYTRKETLEIIEAAVAELKATVAAGEGVFLRGFGTFGTKTRKQKIARNIKANASIVVPEHKIPAFKPAKEFAAAVK